MTEVRICASLATAVEQHLHIQRRIAPPKMHSATSVGRGGHFKGTCRSKKEEGRAKDVKRKLKQAKAHELKVPQATAGTWSQQPYVVQDSLPPPRGLWGVTSHHMETVQVNRLNKQEDNKCMRPLWLTRHPNTHPTNSTMKLAPMQSRTSCSCTSRDQFLGKGDQNSLQLSSLGMVTHQWAIQGHAEQYSLLDVRCQGKPCSKSWIPEGTWFSVERQWGGLGTNTFQRLPHWSWHNSQTHTPIWKQ